MSTTYTGGGMGGQGAGQGAGMGGQGGFAPSNTDAYSLLQALYQQRNTENQQLNAGGFMPSYSPPSGGIGQTSAPPTTTQSLQTQDGVPAAYQMPTLPQIKAQTAPMFQFPGPLNLTPSAQSYPQYLQQYLQQANAANANINHDIFNKGATAPNGNGNGSGTGSANPQPYTPDLGINA